MAERFFSSNMDGSVTSWIDTEDGFAIKRSMDVSPILEHNKALRLSGRKQSKDMKHVAAIPLIICEKWKAELGVDIYNPDHMPKIIKLLNDPEYAYLRTADGKL